MLTATRDDFKRMKQMIRKFLKNDLFWWKYGFSGSAGSNLQESSKAAAQKGRRKVSPLQVPQSKAMMIGFDDHWLRCILANTLFAKVSTPISTSSSATTYKSGTMISNIVNMWKRHQTSELVGSQHLKGSERFFQVSEIKEWKEVNTKQDLWTPDLYTPHVSNISIHIRSVYIYICVQIYRYIYIYLYIYTWKKKTLKKKHIHMSIIYTHHHKLHSINPIFGPTKLKSHSSD